jgi:hypothetical protein
LMFCWPCVSVQSQQLINLIHTFLFYNKFIICLYIIYNKLIIKQEFVH